MELSTHNLTVMWRQKHHEEIVAIAKEASAKLFELFEGYAENEEDLSVLRTLFMHSLDNNITCDVSYLCMGKIIEWKREKDRQSLDI